MEPGLSSPGGVGSTPSRQSAIGQWDWDFYTVQGVFDPGEIYLHPRGVGVVEIQTYFRSGDIGSYPPRMWRDWGVAPRGNSRGAPGVPHWPRAAGEGGGRLGQWNWGSENAAFKVNAYDIACKIPANHSRFMFPLPPNQHLVVNPSQPQPTALFFIFSSTTSKCSSARATRCGERSPDGLSRVVFSTLLLKNTSGTYGFHCATQLKPATSLQVQAN